MRSTSLSFPRTLFRSKRSTSTLPSRENKSPSNATFTDKPTIVLRHRYLHSPQLNTAHKARAVSRGFTGTTRSREKRTTFLSKSLAKPCVAKPVKLRSRDKIVTALLTLAVSMRVGAKYLLTCVTPDIPVNRSIDSTFINGTRRSSPLCQISASLNVARCRTRPLYRKSGKQLAMSS